MDYPKIISLAPELERFCKEIEKDINRGGAVWYRKADGSICKEVDKENEIRELLKSRVKRIKIDTY
jgi:hypothetical protein